MKKPRPIVYSLEEIVITREKDGVIIEYKEPGYGSTYFRMPRRAVRELTDEDIVAFYNAELKAQAARAAKTPYTAREVPLNSPQIEYVKGPNQWTPRGDVLRCLVHVGEDAREPVIKIDETELSWDEFGELLCAYEGWGMRIEFVPDHAIHRRPSLVVRESN